MALLLAGDAIAWTGLGVASHASLDAPAAVEHSLLDQLASPEPEWAGGSAADGLALERLVDHSTLIQINGESYRRKRARRLGAPTKR